MWLSLVLPSGGSLSSHLWAEGLFGALGLAVEGELGVLLALIGLVALIILIEEELDLLEERGEEIFFLEAGDDVLAAIDGAVSGDDDDGGLGALGVDLLGELEAVHAFHAEVGDQDVEILLIEFFEGVSGAIGADRFVALHIPKSLRTEWDAPIEREKGIDNPNISYPEGVDADFVYGVAKPSRYLPTQTMRHVEFARLGKLDEATQNDMLLKRTKTPQIL